MKYMMLPLVIGFFGKSLSALKLRERYTVSVPTISRRSQRVDTPLHRAAVMQISYTTGKKMKLLPL